MSIAMVLLEDGPHPIEVLASTLTTMVDAEGE